MVLKRAEAFELREPGVSYKIDFGLKTTMLGLETSILGTLMQRFQYDNLARPHFPSRKFKAIQPVIADG